MKKTFLTILIAGLAGCTSINRVGDIGPNHLRVYSIKDSDFLSANRMLVILNKSGDVAAYSGGTVSGAGTVGLQTAGTVATAGATVLGAKAIQHGLQNTNIKGIPSSFNVNTKSKLDVSGSVDKHIHQ